MTSGHAEALAYWSDFNQWQGQVIVTGMLTLPG